MIATIEHHARRRYKWSPVECAGYREAQIYDSTADAGMEHAARNTVPQAVIAPAGQLM
jgi:hypothetical protein